jgi:hypothetical protein
LQEEIIQRRGILSVVLALLVIVSFGFLLLLFRGYRSKRNVNKTLELKVGERTHELEVSRTALLRELKAQEIIMHQASEGIRDARRSIEGLCFIAAKEIGSPVADLYLRRINETASFLDSYFSMRK